MIELIGKTIAVWFSCGAASAVAAYYTIKKYGKANDVRILNNPVIEEDSDNQRFLEDVQEWLGYPIGPVLSSKYPNCSAVEVWQKRKYMSGIAGAPCTYELKKRARQEWEAIHKPDYHVLGFTADEKKRHERFILTERDNLLPVLIDRGLTKEDCFKVLLNVGIKPPRMYDYGYPNANCIGCVKATSPSYWNLVREKHPEVFEARAKQSREIGTKLVRVNNKRIQLDELKEADTGNPINSYDLECGVFCQEEMFLHTDNPKTSESRCKE